MDKATIRNLLRRDRKTIAELISWVEDSTEKARDIINSILQYTGNAYVIGVTGPPGCGKSTLIEKLAIKMSQSDNKHVGIISLEPSSPISGGAFMGNRIRMRKASERSSIFIRSMASRGSLGGLSRATSDAIKVLDAAGMDYIILETVGAGQVQTDIAKTANTVIAVLQPQTGDFVQIMKAGFMEIGDIFVINKSDLEGADKTANDLSEMLSMIRYNNNGKKWKPKIVRTVATTGKGISDLMCSIETHREYLVSSGIIVEKQKEIAINEIEKIIDAELKERLAKKLTDSKFQASIGDIITKKISAYDVARALVVKGEKEGKN